MIKKKNKFYFLLILFLIFNTTGIYSANLFDGDVDCNNFIYGFHENLNIEKYIEDNPFTKKSNNVYLQLDLFPEINSLKCLGKTINIDSNLDYEIYATSFSLYKLVLFFSIVFLFLIFSLFRKKSIFLYTLVSFINLISIIFIFFGKIIFDFRLLGIIVLNSYVLLSRLYKPKRYYKT